MKRFALFGTLALVAALAAGLVVTGSRSADAAPTTFEIDARHSTVLYRIDHMGVGAHYGRFNTFSGAFTLDGDNAAGCSVNVTIEAASVDSGDDGRDEHLKGPDFLNVAEHPKVTFQSTEVAKNGSTFEVKGKLTFHGVTKEITTRLEKIGEKDLGEHGGYRAGFEGHFTIKRSDFGMGWGLDNGALGDEVRLTLAFEGVRK